MGGLIGAGNIQVKGKSLREWLEEVGKEYGFTQNEVVWIFDEVAGRFLSEVFGYEVEFFCEKGVFCVFKEEDVQRESVEVLSKGIIKGICARFKEEIKRRSEEEWVLKYYRLIKRRIKSLVKGRLILKKGDDWYVEFEVEDERFMGVSKRVRLIGVCPKRHQRFSDRIYFKNGMEKWFMIKDCSIEKIDTNYKLKILLSRRSKIFFSLFLEKEGGKGVFDILCVRKHGEPVVVILAKEKIEKRCIEKLRREIQEKVIVKYGKEAKNLLWEKRPGRILARVLR